MKVSVLASVAAVIVGAAAQGDKLPPCAADCVTKYTSGSIIGKCAQLDVKCICSDNDFLNNLACCLSAACDKAAQDEAVLFAKGLCSGQGVKTPDQVVCSAAGTSAASAAPTTSASSSSSAAGAAAATGKPLSNATTTAASHKPTSGAASGVVGVGGVLGAAAAAAFAYAL